jgi:hypothetical protein
VNRWYAASHPQRTLPGTAAYALTTSSERIDSEPRTGRRISV